MASTTIPRSKKRKISDLKPEDANSLFDALTRLKDSLDEDDSDLPVGLITSLEQVREKLQGKEASPERISRY
jgi:uncharacterized membrane protein